MDELGPTPNQRSRDAPQAARPQTPPERSGPRGAPGPAGGRRGRGRCGQRAPRLPRTSGLTPHPPPPSPAAARSPPPAPAPGQREQAPSRASALAPAGAGHAGPYLEDEHLPAQDGQGVEVPVADAGLGPGGCGPARGRPRWPRPVVPARVGGRHGAGWRCRGQGSRWRRSLVGRPFRKEEDNAGHPSGGRAQWLVRGARAAGASVAQRATAVSRRNGAPGAGSGPRPGLSG